ncbi:dTDP-D-glucose 4,6-dehydratase isoform X3 [Kryptolebias marmoratus]|uniref:dTDP-D-glucose 4,6-dehydratase isoform X3 n=1 Tax=Kryptolebias marmoratus TaxID=37003 RepID=UPI0007F90F90|nr:dTDP-D-glucose 4,6-dehydratase isoform X3 [Kryptolebias marmoratus]
MEDWEMDFNRTVLVTGGSGFIGSHLVCSLVSSHPDWRIINLDNLDYCHSPRSLESIENRNNYTFIRGDVCNSRLVNHIFSTENIDAVFHLAAKTHVESSFESSSSFQRVNVDGTRVLLDAAHCARRRPQRFIYVSSDEVYGGSRGEVFDESSPLRPTNPYAVTKAAAEHLVRSYWDKYQEQQHLRAPAIHGEGDSQVSHPPAEEQEMVSLHTIQGTLPVSRHFLFVSDAVNAFLLVLERGAVGETYNVGTSFEIPIVQLAQELVRTVKNVPESEVSDWLEFVPNRPRVDLRYPIRCEKLQQLGWRADVSWAEGIRQTVKWYQDNQDFWSNSEDQTKQKQETSGLS